MIVNGIHSAFLLATASTFVVGIFTALLAAAMVLVLMPAGKIGERQAGDIARTEGFTPEPAPD